MQANGKQSFDPTPAAGYGHVMLAIDQVIRTSSCLTFNSLVILFLIRRGPYLLRKVFWKSPVFLVSYQDVCLYLIPELRKKERGK